MSIERAWRTSDGTFFEDYLSAQLHEEELECKANRTHFRLYNCDIEEIPAHGMNIGGDAHYAVIFDEKGMETFCREARQNIMAGGNPVADDLFPTVLYWDENKEEWERYDSFAQRLEQMKCQQEMMRSMFYIKRGES